MRPIFSQSLESKKSEKGSRRLQLCLEVGSLRSVVLFFFGGGSSVTIPLVFLLWKN